MLSTRSSGIPVFAVTAAETALTSSFEVNVNCISQFLKKPAVQVLQLLGRSIAVSLRLQGTGKNFCPLPCFVQ